METQDLSQLNVRVPEGMIRVLDALAERAHMTRAHYLAVLVKQAQVTADVASDAETRRKHGTTELTANIAEHSMDLLQDGRRVADRVV